MRFQYNQFGYIKSIELLFVREMCNQLVHEPLHTYDFLQHNFSMLPHPHKFIIHVSIYSKQKQTYN
jgi:hypothetical protein